MDKAQKIINEYENKINHFNTSYRAGICPECEEKLKVKEEIITYNYTSRFLWIKRNKSRTFKEFKIFCPNNHKLTHPYYNSEVSSPDLSIFNQTLNEDIIKAQSKDDWDDDFY